MSSFRYASEYRIPITEADFCANCLNNSKYRESICSYFLEYNQEFREQGGAGAQWIGLCQECLNYTLSHGCIDAELELE